MVDLVKVKNKMAYTAKDPWRFLFLRETKSWRCEEGGGEKVSLKTHATARGVGKKRGHWISAINMFFLVFFTFPN